MELSLIRNLYFFSQIYETEKFDPLISAIGMPEKDGLDLIPEIKSRTDLIRVNIR